MSGSLINPRFRACRRQWRASPAPSQKPMFAVLTIRSGSPTAHAKGLRHRSYLAASVDALVNQDLGRVMTNPYTPGVRVISRDYRRADRSKRLSSGAYSPGRIELLPGRKTLVPETSWTLQASVPTVQRFQSTSQLYPGRCPQTQSATNQNLSSWVSHPRTGIVPHSRL